MPPDPLVAFPLMYPAVPGQGHAPLPGRDLRHAEAAMEQMHELHKQEGYVRRIKGTLTGGPGREGGLTSG
jgi:hypothetical protein